MDLRKDNSVYRLREYWDERFEEEEEYEWLASYKDVRSQIRSVIPSTSRVLVVGHGNSRLGIDLHEDGYRNVTNSDFSKVVIDKMKARYPQLLWIEADMLSLSRCCDFVEKFDYVLDKAAMDALVTDEGDPWNPSERTREEVGMVCREARSVLKEGGKLIQISFQQPHFRKALMSSEAILEEVRSVEVGLGYFFYVWKFCS